MGAGRTETARALFGADVKESGDVYVEGEKVNIHSPQDAVHVGIGYLSEDRKRYGVVLLKNICENSTLACLQNYVKHASIIDSDAERAVTQHMVDALKTKTPGVDQLVINLSGGNQQKVVVAKWLISNSKILIFDEPTRGIDVGAKQEIYELMNRLVQEGKSIIMISSEMPEILRMSDRIIVMCEGKKTAEFDVAEATQEKIMNAATREIAV
jgi:ribose transport system ATP-binding protein